MVTLTGGVTYNFSGDETGTNFLLHVFDHYTFNAQGVMTVSTSTLTPRCVG